MIPEANQPRQRVHLTFSRIPGPFAVCRLAPDAAMPEWALLGPIFSVTRTAEELSIVCLRENLPPEIDAGQHWTCFKLEGPFAFTQIGILASFLNPLVENGIPIFAISTYDTDYVLVSEEDAQRALQALQAAGHELRR